MYNTKKLKTLKKFKLKSLFGFTTKKQVSFKYDKNKLKEYKFPTNIKILKTLYDIKIKKLKQYFNKFLFSNLYKFFSTLKLRLDFTLFYLNLFLTLNHARQNISHNHVLLNNKIIKKSSYCIKNNDIIHLCNISNETIIKTLTYNYLIKNINTHNINNGIYKHVKRYKPYYWFISNVLIKLNLNNFNNIVCNKNFKIKINKAITINPTL